MVRYRINRWVSSYAISGEEMDRFESFAFSLGLKMEVRYRYAGGAQWKNLDRVFFYDGERRVEGKTKAEIVCKNGGYELIIYDKEIDEQWRRGAKNKQDI